MKQIIAFLVLFLAFSFAVSGQTNNKKNKQNSKEKRVEKQFINPDGLPKVPSYSQAVAVTGGKTVYISGQVSVNAKGETVGKGDLREQTRQTFENLKTVLEASGATFNDVVKLTYFVREFKSDYLPLIREVRAQYLPKDNPPASTLIGVTALASDDFLIEVEAVVIVK